MSTAAIAGLSLLVGIISAFAMLGMISCVVWL